MKVNKKLLIALICLGLVSCNQNVSRSSSSSGVVISSSSLVSSSNSEVITSSSKFESSSSSIKDSDSSSTSITSSASSSLNKESSSLITSSVSSSHNKESSSTKESSVVSSIISNKVETYNPDGTAKLPVPKKSINSTWGQNGKFFDINNSFPDEFSCIYGKQIIDTPPYYATGNWKITYPNSGTRMGFQSPLFEEDLKLEVWFTVDEIHGNSDKLDQTNPWIRIYGFSKDGTLLTTKEIESPSSFTEREYHYAFNGEGVNYFELRFMSQPHKGTKCYNFGISQIGVKSFPYPYND